ncbi:MAG: nicotinate-nucleotide adenylyltransferase [Alphaproteobacteria bacterium]|jgi:nicotinate-nucleotide adenylyltransferase
MSFAAPGKPGRKVILRQANWIRPPGPLSQGLRIGLLGGSFNPAHQGHLHISKSAIRTLGLDHVWWLVSPQNPLKPKSGMASLGERLNSARNVAQHPRIIVTDIETQLDTLYTIETLTVLLRRFPAVHFVWLMGSDNLVQFPYWRNWQDIFLMTPIAVISRPGSALNARCGTAAQKFAHARVPADEIFATRLPPAWTIIEAQRDRTSATQIRSQSQR